LRSRTTDAGAEVGELAGGEGGGDGLLEGDDQDAVQSGPHQIRFLAMSWRQWSRMHHGW
jgi:hypothetical protein